MNRKLAVGLVGCALVMGCATAKGKIEPKVEPPAYLTAPEQKERLVTIRSTLRVEECVKGKKGEKCRTIHNGKAAGAAFVRFPITDSADLEPVEKVTGELERMNREDFAAGYCPKRKGKANLKMEWKTRGNDGDTNVSEHFTNKKEDAAEFCKKEKK